MNVWEQIKQELASCLTRESFQNWLDRTALDRIEDNTLHVVVPDESSKLWLEEEYRPRIDAALRRFGDSYRGVVYHLLRNGDGWLGSPTGNAPEAVAPAGTIQLNPKFTFANFVVGSCNQFAHAAARAVSTTPARSYNPLFIYGGTGMGKTHLMHAIGHVLLQNFSGMRVVYTYGERFVNDLVRCIRTDQMASFRERYRQADVLMVDDVHVFANKERTQEEFFHTFNELFERQKQIVLSSDSPPKQTPGLVERLRSRFEWGLLVDVQPPDLETKMAILDRKAEVEGIHLPEDVRILIATRTRSSVRELEGALIRLVAYASVMKEKITLPMARQVLRDLGVGQEKRISMESIIKVVAERFEVSPAHLKQKSNARRVAYPRQIAMYLIKELTPASLPEIGRAFNGKHHTTVLHSIHKIERQRDKDPDLNKLIHSLIDTIQ